MKTYCTTAVSLGFRVISDLYRALYGIFRVPTVATLWTRAQLRWLGHLARVDEGRVARRLLGAVRVEPGQPGRGNRGAPLMGIFGQEGRVRIRRAQQCSLRLACACACAAVGSAWLGSARLVRLSESGK